MASDSSAPPDLTEAQQSSVTDALRRILGDRAAIEQIKGGLVVIYGITADEAFDKLSDCSQHANVKLHDVARQLVDDIRRLNSLGMPAHTGTHRRRRVTRKACTNASDTRHAVKRRAAPAGCSG